MKIPTLETERLRLRALENEDFESYAGLYAGAEVLLGCCPRCSESLRGFRHPFNRTLGMVQA